MRERPIDLLLGNVPVMVIVSVVAVSFAAWWSPRLMLAFILDPYRIRKRKEVHRLVTAGWVHADTTHLLLNMLTLWIFAGEVVRVVGGGTFFAVYVSSVIVACIPTTIRHWKNSAYRSLGASGGVAAVMFSAILLHPGLDLYLLFLPIRVPGLVYALVYLAYTVWRSRTARDGINHDAHFAGAVYGAAITFFLEPARVEKTMRTFL